MEPKEIKEAFYSRVAILSNNPKLSNDYSKVFAISNKILLVGVFNSIIYMRKYLLASANELDILIVDLDSSSLDDINEITTIQSNMKLLGVSSGLQNFSDCLTKELYGYISNTRDFCQILDGIEALRKEKRFVDDKTLDYMFDLCEKSFRFKPNKLVSSASRAVRVAR